jgi:hypothetical protein
VDDFLFGAEADSSKCQFTLQTFRDICKLWGVPVAEDKTVEPTEILAFLGIEFHTLAMELRLLNEKLVELKHTLELFVQSKKVTIQLQSLIGLLNFVCQVVLPGRAFCRRLIDATCNIRKPHHRIRVSKSMREDIKVWLTFLSEYNGVTVITDNAWASNETLELFIDSAVVKTESLVFIFKENGRNNAGQKNGKKWAFSRSSFRLLLHCVSGRNS